MENLKYKVVAFEEVTKKLHVDFGKEGWASIQLTVPLPTTKEELEAIIKQYAPTVEVVAAVKEQADLSFVRDMVGKSHECERHSHTHHFNAKPAGATKQVKSRKTNDFAMMNEPNQPLEVNEADVQHIKDVLVKVLPEMLPVFLNKNK